MADHGLWLRIEYMDGYRAFTDSAECFPDVQATFAKLIKHARWKTFELA